jgi:proteasome accessory factor B
MKQSPAERLFTLTCYLLSTEIKGLSKQDIYRAVLGYQEAKSQDAVDRLFERDKKSLKDAGIQLEVINNFGFDEGDTARYRIAKESFQWPKGLTLDSAKMQLLELAAKSWNNQVLEGSAQSGLTRLKSLGLVASNTDLTPFTPRLLTRHAAFAPLARAIDTGAQVAFRYQKPDGSLSDRIVDPQSLRQIEGQWVLLAIHDGQAKNFLLRRIVSDVTVLEAEAKRLNSAELQQVEQELNDFVRGNLATIKVTADTEAQLALNPDQNGIAKINFMDEALLAEDLLEFGSDVEVIEPDSLKRRIRASLKAVMKQHA